MQQLFLNQNLFAIGIQTGIWLPSLIMALITSSTALKAEGRLRRISFYFALFCFAISLTYISWTARALFFSDEARPSEGWFVLWQFAYGPGVLAFFFLALWSLSLVNPEFLESKKWIIPALLVPWIIVVIDITLITTAESAQLKIFANIQDILPDTILSLFATLAVIFYTSIPILGFGRYLISKSNRHTTNFRKILIIEIGLVFFLLGSLVDASKAFSNEVLFVSRFFMGSGIILMFFGLRLPKRFHLK